MKLDEAALSACIGYISGHIGSSGANKDMQLTLAIIIAKKKCSQMATRNCKKYAQKVITSTKDWRNNILSISTWSSSIRFATGCGFSSGVTTWHTNRS